MLPYNEDKHYANAGKVSSANVSESGGGEIKSLSKSNKDKSESNSPFSYNAQQTISPKQLKPVFNPIKEESKENNKILKSKSRTKLKPELHSKLFKNKDSKYNIKSLKDEKPKMKKFKEITNDLKLKKISKKPAKKINKRNSLDAKKQPHRNDKIKEYMTK